MRDTEVNEVLLETPPSAGFLCIQGQVGLPMGAGLVCAYRRPDRARVGLSTGLGYRVFYRAYRALTLGHGSCIQGTCVGHAHEGTYMRSYEGYGHAHHGTGVCTAMYVGDFLEST